MNCSEIKLFFPILWLISSLSISSAYKNNADASCNEFISTFYQVIELLHEQTEVAKIVEDLGVCPHSSDDEENIDETGKILTIMSQVFQNKKNLTTSEFMDLAKRCMPVELLERKPAKIHPKYRSIDGSGNNRIHPDWGSTGTPFSRLASKRYEDGIYMVKKSVVDGSDLPNPRLIVQEILQKAVRSPPAQLPFNILAPLFVLFVTHDIHYQIPNRLSYSDCEIGCCTSRNKEKLPSHLTNPDCMPIEIPKNDDFFKNGQIGCQNMVRSQLGRYADGVETGEILNHATAYMDLSLIYGNRESELQPIRLHKDGKLRMDKNNVLPVDEHGKYLKSMDRFINTPIATIWPALFARNHNHLAERLAKLNPHWDDEIVFQEARRINIAIFQFNLITAESIEQVFGEKINETYSESRNAAVSLEFAFVYRAGHIFVPNEMIFEQENGTKRGILQSDTIGKFVSTVAKSFDEALRGASNTPLNVGLLSDEV